MAFKLTEEDHCESRYQFAEDFRTDSSFLAEENILLQHHTVLDRNMVSGKDALSALISRIERNYCLIGTGTSYLAVYLTFSYYFIFDRIVCV